MTLRPKFNHGQKHAAIKRNYQWTSIYYLVIVRVTAHVILGQDYPLSPPLLLLQLEPKEEQPLTRLNSDAVLVSDTTNLLRNESTSHYCILSFLSTKARKQGLLITEV